MVERALSIGISRERRTHGMELAWKSTGAAYARPMSFRLRVHLKELTRSVRNALGAVQIHIAHKSTRERYRNACLFFSERDSRDLRGSLLKRCAILAHQSGQRNQCKVKSINYSALVFTLNRRFRRARHAARHSRREHPICHRILYISRDL